MQPARDQAKDDVAGTDSRAVDHARSLDDADAATGQVELVDLEDTRMLGRLPTDQRRTGLATAGSHAADELGHGDRVEPADGHVVEERQRLGAGADHVVGAHRDEVDADGVEPADGRGDDRLRADPVGRGDQERLAIALRDRERTTEPTQTTDDLGPARRVDMGADELDGLLPGVDIDAGASIGGAARFSHARRRRLLRG